MVPSKSPMKYWPAEPLLGPPGLRLTVRTHLTFSRVAVHGQRKQVRAFPNAAGGVCRPEGAQQVPSLQVAGFVEDHLEVFGFDGDHHPVAVRATVVPDDFGIPELGGPAVEDGVACVFCPAVAPVLNRSAEFRDPESHPVRRRRGQLLG